MSKLRVTTASGAIYTIDEATKLVTGGSKDLKAGKLLSDIHINRSLYIGTPERAKLYLRPGAMPSVISTPVVSIELVLDN